MARTFDFPITTNDQSIDRVLNAGLPVALVFLNGAAASALETAMHRLAKSYAGQALVVRVPLADSPQAAARFGVHSGPTLVTMRGDLEKCIASGANDYLSKPVDAERMFSMLRVWRYQ